VFEDERPALIPHAGRFDGFHDRFVRGHTLFELGKLQLELIEHLAPRSDDASNLSRRILAMVSLRASISALWPCNSAARPVARASASPARFSDAAAGQI